MNRETILQILYEMALVTGGETHVEPLITKTLQRLLYHTSFPCGVFLSGMTTDSNANIEACVEEIIGGGGMFKNKGEKITLPNEFIHWKPGLLTNSDQIQNAFSTNMKYTIALKLPVNEHEQFILLSQHTPSTNISFERIFEPVLVNFGKALRLCRDNDKYTSLLEQEVSRRSKLEITLRESQELLKNVLNTVPSRIFWKDTNSVYIGCNDLFAKDAGFDSSNEIIGKTDFNLPWSTTQASSYILDDKKIMQSGKSKLNIEESQTRENNSETWLEISKIPLVDSKNSTVGILGSYTDITERKIMQRSLQESETRHRAIFQSAVDGIIIIDTRGIIETINPAIIKIFGYTSDELVGNNISMLMPEPFASQHDIFISSFTQKGSSTILGRERELFAQRKDGSVFPVDIALDEMLLDSKRMFTGIIRDVTDRKEDEQKIIRSKEEAERANQAKSDFLSNMSHELRTPLNAILGFSQLIEFEDTLPTDVAENNQEILSAGHHLLKLINEVLDLSKIEAGHIDLTLEPVVYNDLLLECISLIDPIAKSNEINIIYPNNSDNILLRADRIRLKQVIVNLLSNAIKYNKKSGDVNINIEIVREDFCRISFRDTGQGIKQENISSLFKIFNRLEAENSAIEGTGIGLVITKRLVELMAGNIGVESEYGIGSTFWIEIPIETENTTTSRPASGNTESLTNAVKKQKRVLYIEDNPANLKLVSKLFSKKPHITLLTAHTPSLGLTLADINQLDLILLDIQMPEMDGYKVLDILRHNDKTSLIPVIGISASAMPSDFKKAKDAGFNQYISKPLDINNFYTVIDNILSDKK